jgi:hypothetical protein
MTLLCLTLEAHGERVEPQVHENVTYHLEKNNNTPCSLMSFTVNPSESGFWGAGLKQNIYTL